MSEATELTMEDLHNATSAEVAAAAAAEDRIPAGNYLAKTTAVFAKRNPDDAEYNAGRSVASLAVELLDPNDPTSRIGKTFLQVSWEPRYNQSGKLDNAARRYTELQKALGISGNPGEVLEAAKQQLFSIKVRESFKVPAEDLHESHLDARPGNDGEYWVNIPAGADDVYAHYADLGYDGRVMIDRVFRAR